MKNFTRITISILLICILILFTSNNRAELNSGDILFISFNANDDNFEIITFVDLPPRTVIYFTDSEWNGNHFGFDESNLIWNTGKKTITKGSMIRFNNLATNPNVSYGTLNNTMRISKNRDAIFAYIGTNRMPTKILAAVSNDKLAYGTLLNTGLKPGISALTFPRGTHFASYQGATLFQNLDEFIKAINTTSNYKYE